MNILFCAAEQEELDCAISSIRPYESKIADKVRVEFLLTGIGSTSTCYRLTKKILEEQSSGSPISLVVNIGLSGSYNLEKFPIGSVGVVESQRSGDLGFLTKEGFKSLFEAKDLNANMFPYSDRILKMPKLSPFFDEIFSKYKLAQGNTVQTITKKEFVNKESQEYDLEVMEGAAVFYVCLSEHVHFVELRAVSYPVGEVDSDNWDVVSGLKSLHAACSDFFRALAKE